MRIIDVSLALNNQTPIYPGNFPISVDVHHAMPEYVTHLSKISFGSHTGTHIDAPAHCISGAHTIDQIPLDTFLGPCRVLDFSNESSEAITLEFLQSKNILKGDKILFKTKNSLRGFEEFYDDYIYLSGDGADYLAEISVSLIGVDSLSIKKRGGKDQRPHNALLQKNIPIIEGLDLSQAQEGSYDLICMPLKFTGIEGAPVRVLLIER